MTREELLAQPRRLWIERTPREQGLIAAAAVLLAGLIVWQGVLAPAAAYRDAERARYEAAVEAHRELVSGIVLHRRLAARAEDGGGTAPSRPLRTVVGRSAEDSGLAITRVRPDETGRLTVWMDNVRGDRLVEWLAELAREENIAVSRLTLDAEGDGRVRAQILLARGAG